MKKQMTVGIVLTLLIIAFVGIYWANESSRQTAAQQTQFTQELKLGARTYTLQCAECHGDNGEGFQGPALNGTDLPRDTFTKIVERGMPHTIMPAWSVDDSGPLQPHEIQEVVDFIYNWNDKVLAAARAELGPEAGGMESQKFASPGEALYHSKGCAECHGDDALGLVFKYSRACSNCHVDETRLLVYGPSLPGHPDDVIKKQVREGGIKMPSFSEDVISDADLQAIIAFLNSLPVPRVAGVLKASLEEALAALSNEQISLAKEKLAAALAAAQLDVQKAEIEKIIEDVDRENYAEAAELIQSLLEGEAGNQRHVD